MFNLGDLLIHKDHYNVGVRMVVSIGSTYYKLKIIAGDFDGATLYIPLELTEYYEKIGNIFENKSKKC